MTHVWLDARARTLDIRYVLKLYRPMRISLLLTNGVYPIPGMGNGTYPAKLSELS